MFIVRDLNARLESVAAQFPAVFLTGARQTGKSSLLRHLLPHAPFLSLDLPSAAEQASQSPEQFFAGHREPLILDEVQYAPQLFRYLKDRIDADRHRMGRFYLSGSQKFALMKELSESLAGRAAIVELDTLSSHEILHHPATSDTSLLYFLWRGGFPELFRNPELRAQDFYSSYVATYLERDLRSLLQVGSLRDFERFIRACAARNAQLLNLSELSRDVGIAVSTAREWVSVLEASNQVFLLEPYFANIGKRLIKTPKLYFRDTGLLCFLLGFDEPQALLRSTHLGPVWECFVLNQILRHKSATGSAGRIFFFRDAYGTEVDFLFEHNGRLRLAEAKWAEQPDASAARSILKVHPWLGAEAADEHWLICLTPHSHRLADAPTVRAIDGFRFWSWFGEPLTRKAT
jgi:uncharacterized protein